MKQDRKDGIIDQLKEVHGLEELLADWAFKITESDLDVSELDRVKELESGVTGFRIALLALRDLVNE